MKLSISKDEIQEKLSNIQNIVEKKNTMPILSHFLLDASVDGASIMATDLQIAVKEPLKAVVHGEGKLCIPAKKLLEIVREADGDITIESEDEQRIKILSGKSKFRLACLSAGEYPAWPGLESSEEISFSASALTEMIDKSLYSAGETDTRYTLNGLLFHMKPEDNSLTVVGTDGHRLAIIRKGLKGLSKDEKKVILPRKAAVEARKFFGSAETVSAVFGKNHVLFKIGAINFLARLIEGSYPDYEKVIPLSNEKVVTLGREVFLKALRRVSIMSKEHSNAVKMDLSACAEHADRPEGLLVVSSSNPDLGEATDEIAVEYSGDAMTVGFNVRYLIDSLNAMTTPNVVFLLNDPLSPTLLMEQANEDYKCVIMPMRV